MVDAGQRRRPERSDPVSAAVRADRALRRADRHRLLMIFFISSESFFFLSLILAYLLFHGASGPVARAVLDVPRTAGFSLALFASSGTLVLAERGLRARQGGRLRLWLLVTIGLGALFLLGQGLEYRHLIASGLTIDRNLFGTTFFTLTGFHGLHVLLGLLALLVVAGLAFAGDFDDGGETALGTVALYWHFVDGVWVAIFTLVYLWALL
jgi:heme/copper-type cytochrome/quinol oxidase subunit 3